MSRALVIEPEAEADIVAAATWYQEQSPIIGASFSRAVRSALDRVQDNPYQYQTVYDRYRRVLLRRFPYALIYTITDAGIVVLACMHGRRDPKRWQDRLAG